MKVVTIDENGRQLGRMEGDCVAGPGQVSVATFPDPACIYQNGAWVQDPSPPNPVIPAYQPYINAFLMLCDTISQRTTHEKLSFEELPVYLKVIKNSSEPAYNQLRDALMTINMALIAKAGTDWWDNASWNSDETAVNMANRILAAMQ